MDKNQPAPIDTLYYSYDKNLYKASSDPEADTINDILNGYGNSNAIVDNGAAVASDPSTTGSGYTNNTTQLANGNQQTGKTTFDNTQTGFILGIDSADGKAKFYIGNATNYFNWDGNNLTVSGVFTAGSLNIPDTTTASSFHVDGAGNSWWGATTLGAANAYVLNTGVAVFNNTTLNNPVVNNPTITYLAGEDLTAGQAVTSSYYQSDGGVSFDSQGTFTEDGGLTTHTKAFTVGVNSNRILILNLVTNFIISSVKYGGVSMTLATSQSIIGGETSYAYYLIGPTTGNNNIVVVLTSGGRISMAYSSYYNVVQTGQPDVTTVNQANVGTVTQSITTAVAGATVVVLGGAFSSTGTPSVSSISNAVNNFTQINGLANNYSAAAIADTGALFLPMSISNTVTNGGTGTLRTAIIQLSIKPITAPVAAAIQSSTSNGLNNKYISFLGFVTANASKGTNVNIAISGIVTNLSGLTPNNVYYLNDTLGTIGTSPGTNSKKVGISLSTTTLMVANMI